MSGGGDYWLTGQVLASRLPLRLLLLLDRRKNSDGEVEVDQTGSTNCAAFLE